MPGHWEGDLVFGKAMSPVATLVERSTRYLMLVALPGGDHKADAVADALAAAVTTLPTQLARSLTWDQGHEMAAAPAVHHRRPGSRSTSATRSRPGSAAATRTPTGCCASTCPDDSTSAPSPKADFDAIALELNERPRQTLGFKTPSQALAEVLR